MADEISDEQVEAECTEILRGYTPWDHPTWDVDGGAKRQVVRDYIRKALIERLAATEALDIATEETAKYAKARDDVVAMNIKLTAELAATARERDELRARSSEMLDTIRTQDDAITALRARLERVEGALTEYFAAKDAFLSTPGKGPLEEAALEAIRQRWINAQEALTAARAALSQEEAQG